MALPTLDATFASAADLPRRQMLARWLIEELGSGSVANYYDLPERYLWAKIAVAAGAPREEAAYISLPKNYAWSDIYNAVAGLIPPSNVLVSGAGSVVNGIYTYREDFNGRPAYNLLGQPTNQDAYRIRWGGDRWLLIEIDDASYEGDSDTEFPWQTTNWTVSNGESPVPTVTEIPQPSPNHTDWSENVALGHIAAAYRGDTGNPANLATYIDWPWRYKVASIISSLLAPPETETFNAVIVTGAGSGIINSTYAFDGNVNGRPSYRDGVNLLVVISWDGSRWFINESGDDYYESTSDVAEPWLATGWVATGFGFPPAPTLTPTNV